MQRSIIPQIIVLLFFLSISTIPASITALSPSTEPTSPFCIQEAINQAPPGATIQIPPGTYTETLRIDKPLHLTGYLTQTFLAPTSAENGYSICITAEGVILSNLDITNHAEGIYTTAVKISANNTTIQNCTFHGTPIGIAVWSSENIISHCRFIGCDDEGIALLGSSMKPCTNNTITSCFFSENCDGIELQYATTNLIINCRFENNTHAGIDAIQADNNHNTIHHCFFTDNQAFGIYLSKSQDTLISDCTFSGDILTLHTATDTSLQNSTGATIQIQKDSSLSIDHCTDIRYTETRTQHNTYETASKPLTTLEENTIRYRNETLLHHLLSRFPLIRMLYERLLNTQI